ALAVRRPGRIGVVERAVGELGRRAAVDGYGPEVVAGATEEAVLVQLVPVLANSDDPPAVVAFFGLGGGVAAIRPSRDEAATRRPAGEIWGSETVRSSARSASVSGRRVISGLRRRVI